MDIWKVIKEHTKHNYDALHLANGAFLQEVAELKKRKIRHCLELQYQLETLGDFYKDIKRCEEALKAELKVKTAKAHNNLYCWITINPKPTVLFSKFFEKVQKMVKRNIFTDVLYVYEQRGKDMESLGEGFHTHILAKRNLNYKPSKVAKNLRNSCKQLVGNINSNNQVNIQFIGEEYAVDKKQYILGAKTGDGKDIKQQMDIIWRQKNNLKVYYNAQKAQGNYGENTALQGTVKTPN